MAILKIRKKNERCHVDPGHCRLGDRLGVTPTNPIFSITEECGPLRLLANTLFCRDNLGLEYSPSLFCLSGQKKETTFIDKRGASPSLRGELVSAGSHRNGQRHHHT